MRRACVALMVGCLGMIGLGGTPAYAGDVTLQVQGLTRIGLGDWADISNPGLGLNLVGLYKIQPNLAVTGRLGYTFGIPKVRTAGFGGFFSVDVSVKTDEIPLMLGARFYLQGDAEEGGPWLGAELGFTNVTYVVQVEGNEDPSTDSELGPALQLGVGYDIGVADFSLNVNWISQGDNNREPLLGLIFHVGFDVWGS